MMNIFEDLKEVQNEFEELSKLFCQRVMDRNILWVFSEMNFIKEDDDKLYNNII